MCLMKTKYITPQSLLVDVTAIMRYNNGPDGCSLHPQSIETLNDMSEWDQGHLIKKATQWTASKTSCHIILTA